MKSTSIFRKTLLAAGVVIVLVSLGSPARALDAYQDRRGIFSGIGLGGGGVFVENAQGAGLFGDFQLGGGASQNLTLALDLDLWLHVMDGSKRFLLTPGPEVNYFFGDSGVFIRGGVGMALTWFKADFMDSSDFSLGFDTSLGAGWEFFGGANAAMALAVEGDYIFYDGGNVASVAFALNVKFY